MKSSINIGKTGDGKKFCLPAEAVTSVFAIMGQRGSGKTHLANLLAEGMLDIGAQIVVLDPVGNWYGLRLNKDGKSPGYDIPIFGGLRADIPLEPTAGALVAETVVNCRTSVILDVMPMSKNARRQFATDFAEELYRLQSQSDMAPIHLFVEESQLFVPQRETPAGRRMNSAFEDLVRLGRNFGIGATLISQRPQSVSKEVTNQANALAALRTSGAHERDAIKKWIDYQGIEHNFTRDLPKLPTGVAFFWSPSWLDFSGKVHVGEKKTYDASATPRVDRKRRASGELPKLDLEALRKAMAESIERVDAKNPARLNARIKELERELAKTKNAAPPKADRSDIAKEVNSAVAKAVSARDKEWKIRLRMCQRAFDEATAAADKITTALRRCDFADDMPEPDFPERVEPSVKSPKTSVASISSSSSPVVAGEDPLGVSSGSGGRRRILVVLAQWHPRSLSDKQVCLFAKLSASGGTFAKYYGDLVKHGYVSGTRSALDITEAGLAVIGDYESLPTGPRLIDYWRGRLGQTHGTRRIFDALVDAYPGSLSAREIGEAADLTPGSGTYAKYMHTLRTMNLVIKRADGFSAACELFE